MVFKVPSYGVHTFEGPPYIPEFIQPSALFERLGVGSRIKYEKPSITELFRASTS